jgi:hypothetical protein
MRPKIVTALFVMGVLIPPAHAQRSGEFNGNINNNDCTACTADRATFTNEIGYQLIAHMPDKAKPVIVTIVGDRRDQAIGDRVTKFLTDRGYQVIDRRNVGSLTPVPRHPFSVTENTADYDVLVAPEAQ